MFVVLKAFPYAVAAGGDGSGGPVATTFAAFAAASLAMAAYVYARLPETMGKRFDEIEAHFADERDPATTGTHHDVRCKTTYNMTPP